jgi:N-acetyl-alpha-D-muramate 1-phosphate uridylyltransferase
MQLNAFIPAAGLGTRLAPLTLDKPKALVVVRGKTLLEWVIDKLYQLGINNFIINIHYYSAQIVDFVQQISGNYPLARFIFSDESDELLDTGGAIKKVANVYTDKIIDNNYPLLVYNCDILSNIDIEAMYNYHIKAQAFISLAVRERESSRQFIFNHNNELIGWENAKTQAQIFARDSQNATNQNYKKAAFSGIHILSPQAFDYLPKARIFATKDWYLDLAKNNNLLAYYHNEDSWEDVGRYADWERLNKPV